jgi:hypothetical protein
MAGGVVAPFLLLLRWAGYSLSTVGYGYYLLW